MTDAVPDGIRLSAWIDAAPIGKTAAYGLMQALGITPGKARWPGTSAAVSMLDADQQALMDRGAAALAAGRSVADIATAIDRAPSRSAGPIQPRSTANTQPQAPAPALALLERLQAIETAIATGAPLTTADVRQLLGITPGGQSPVDRGRVRAIWHARNCWTLEPVDG